MITRRSFSFLISVIVVALLLLPSCFLLDFLEGKKLEAPVLILLTQQHGDLEKIYLQWSLVNGAELYSLMARDLTAGGDFTGVGMFAETSLDWTGWSEAGWITIAPGHTYEFKVSGHRQSDGHGEYSEPKSYRVPDFSAPKGVSATEVTAPIEGVRISWNAVETADSYDLERLIDGGAFADWDDIVGWNYTETSFVDTDTRPGVTYQYRVRARSDRWYAPSSVTDYSDPVLITLDEPSDQYVWEDLGTSGFGYSEGKPSLALAGSTLYLLFADAQNADNKLKAMAHNGVAADLWYDVGAYISIGAPSGDRAWALAVGETVYAAYGDMEDSDNIQLYIMQSTGGGWSSVGLDDGVAVYDDENEVTIHKTGSETSFPSLVPYGSSGLLIVYISDSGSLAGSLSYPGPVNHWADAHSSYWTDNSISGFETALVLDTAGNPVAALQSGGGVQFYRYNGGSWGPHLGIFDPGDGSSHLYLRGFLIDSANTPYLAYETFAYGDPPLFRSDIARWNVSSWVRLDLPAAIGAPEHIMDVAILEHPDGAGIMAAAACSDGTDYWIGLWAYDGAAWQSAGPLLEGLVGVDSVAMVLDAEDRPVVVYTTGWDQALTAVRLSPSPP